MLERNLSNKFTDINEDGVLCRNDLNAVMDVLTGEKLCEKSKQKMIDHVRGLSQTRGMHA